MGLFIVLISPFEVVGGNGLASVRDGRGFNAVNNLFHFVFSFLFLFLGCFVVRAYILPLCEKVVKGFMKNFFYFFFSVTFWRILSRFPRVRARGCAFN
jgi:hypothetical protein